jgi:hypothetical protein
MTAVLDSMVGRWDALVISNLFRFSEINPLTARPYGESAWRDLPGHAQYVVTELNDLPAGEWDELVKMGETYDFVDPDAPFLVGAWLTAARALCARRPDGGRCPDCWGTCVSFDSDGSATGAVGTPFFCVCTGVFA